MLEDKNILTQKINSPILNIAFMIFKIPASLIFLIPSFLITMLLINSNANIRVQNFSEIPFRELATLLGNIGIALIVFTIGVFLSLKIFFIGVTIFTNKTFSILKISLIISILFISTKTFWEIKTSLQTWNILNTIVDQFPDKTFSRGLGGILGGQLIYTSTFQIGNNAEFQIKKLMIPKIESLGYKTDNEIFYNKRQGPTEYMTIQNFNFDANLDEGDYYNFNFYNPTDRLPSSVEIEVYKQGGKLWSQVRLR